MKNRSFPTSVQAETVLHNLLTHTIGAVLLLLIAIGLTSSTLVADDDFGKLKDDQEAVAGRYARFERMLSQMADMLGREDPERAELLRRAIREGKESAIAGELDAIAESLGKSSFGSAMQKQGNVIKSMQQVLTLLQSEDRRSEVEKERERLNELLKDIRNLTARQKAARAATQNATSPSNSAPEQQETLKKTDGILGGVESHDESQNGKGDSESDSESQDGKQGDESSKGERNTDDSDGKNSDGKDSNGKDSNGKDSDGKDSDGKNSDGKDSDGKKSDGKSSKEDGQESSESPDTDSGQHSDPKDGMTESEQQNQQGQPSSDRQQQQQGQQQQQQGQQQQGQQQQGQQQQGQQQQGQQQQGQQQQGQQQQGQQQQGQQQQGQQQQGQQQQGQQQKKDEQQTPGRKQLEQARQAMQEAIDQLKKQDRKDALKEQDKAIRQLQQAQKKLEETLKQLREEEKEMILAALEARFQRMLSLQSQIYDDTLALASTPRKEWLNTAITGCRIISQQQADLTRECSMTVGLLREDGTSVSILIAVEDIEADMQTVASRLQQTKAFELTQSIQTDIIEALKELIETAQKEMEEMKKEKQDGPKQSGPQQQSALVELMAEIKVLRSLQLRVNRRTATVDRLLQSEDSSEHAGLHQQLQELVHRQNRLTESALELAKQMERRQR